MILAPREIIVAPRLITYGGGRKPSVLLLERIRESRRGEKKRGEFRFHDFFLLLRLLLERERLLSVRVVCFATPLKKTQKKKQKKNNIMVIMN